MKTLFLLIFLSLFSIRNYGQAGEAYYNKGLECAQKGELENAVQFFDSSIAVKADEYVVWYNRGIVKLMMRRYEDALTDLEQTIKLNAAYKKSYLNRGTAKKHLTNYEGAMTDYTLALQLDTNYGEAYYNRGLVYELFENMEPACIDFNKANLLGYKSAAIKSEHCKDTTHLNYHPVLLLTKTAKTIKYGFTPQTPVKVGNGPDGGHENERAYLDLLRDMNGKPVNYHYIGSCCGYASINAPKGLALLDKYEISLVNEAGEKKAALVYLSFYDYEEPQILSGLKTVAAP